MPISDKYNDYAKEIYHRLFAEDIRVEMDERAEKIGYKIREAQLKRIPYMLIVGEEEEKNHTISIRHRRDGDLGSQSLDPFVAKICKEIRDRTLDV